MCGAGYFCDQLGTTKTGRPQCAAGHYCPSFQSFVTAAGAGTPEYRQMPCAAGTYNANTASTTQADCAACPAGKACEYQGLTSTASLPDCAAGSSAPLVPPAATHQVRELQIQARAPLATTVEQRQQLRHPALREPIRIN